MCRPSLLISLKALIIYQSRYVYNLLRKQTIGCDPSERRVKVKRKIELRMRPRIGRKKLTAFTLRKNFLTFWILARIRNSDFLLRRLAATFLSD